MREKILANIRDINPWIFTGIAIVLSLVLTAGLNFFFAWLEGDKINPRIFMYAMTNAIVMPLVISPIITIDVYQSWVRPSPAWRKQPNKISGRFRKRAKPMSKFFRISDLE